MYTKSRVASTQKTWSIFMQQDAWRPIDPVTSRMENASEHMSDSKWPPTVEQSQASNLEVQQHRGYESRLWSMMVWIEIPGQ